MRRVWKEIGTALLLGGLLPSLMVNASALLVREKPKELPITVTTAPQAETSLDIRLRQADGTVEEMGLEAYLTGVLLGEVPADFEPEALKAQAVAARTYTAKAVLTGGKHGDGSLCTDFACCQAYLPEEDYLEAGGTEEGLEKIRGAVTDTAGLVLSYEGSLIEATYFSCSGGRTEDAQAVWGTDYPYLRAVASPGEEAAAHYEDEITVEPGLFQEKLGRQLGGSPEEWFGKCTRTPGGGVDTLEIGGERDSGVRLRQLFGLPSTAFTVSVEAGKIVFRTKGFGHRVGMSQYGADAMAATGRGFREILEHYYPGTKVEELANFVS